MNIVIKDGKIRTGTAAPYGWVKNTFTNRFVYGQKFCNDYDKPFVVVLWRLFLLNYIHMPCYQYITKNWMRLRCLVGLHQKNMYLYSLDGKMKPYCFWCKKRIGDDFVPNMDDYHNVINAVFSRNKK